jgi:cytochrome c oxidase assembly protein subunit 15
MPMAQDKIRDNSRPRVIRAWLITVAALVFATLLVGGATRLTESGLSITEWQPVAGALPPLSEADWQMAFEKYQAIPQYRELNRGMSLDQFKTIYWWEWSHRLLARSVGMAFLLPFLFFLWKGWVPPGLHKRLWVIFGLGGLLGVVGWWMVYSGLSARVSVSQYRLAVHLTLACFVFAALIWTAQRLVSAQGGAVPAGLRIGAEILLGLVFFQIYLGALVAGLDAGLSYNTWPLIDGAFIPTAERLFFESPLWRNFFENTLTVQFLHRMTAYTLWAAALLYAVYATRAGTRLARSAWTLAVGVTLQVTLGIVTLLHQAPTGLSLAHQALAVIVLALAVVHAERAHPRQTARVEHLAVAEAEA